MGSINVWAENADSVVLVTSDLFAVAGGTVDAITATFSPALTSYEDGVQVKVRASGANTSTTPTLNANGLGAKTITKEGNQALLAGDIPGIDYEAILRYNASNDVFELLNPINMRSDLASTATDDGSKGRNIVYWPRTPQEVSAGITPVSYQHKPGKVRRYMTFAQITDALLTTPTFDHTTMVQNAITAAPINGTVDCEELNLRVSVTKGTNDKYGLNIQTNGVKLIGSGTLKRLDGDISTYAKSYPIIFVGVPDNNSGVQVKNVKIKGINFIGEDTRHTSAGSAIHDGRCAIECKNTKNFRAVQCDFTKIDSSAIWFQKPAEYDYENSAYYNTTKNYNAKLLNCTFEGESHTTAGRSYMKAIQGTGCDGLLISNNYFEWCDTCVNFGGTYDDMNDVETDTYSDSNLGTVKRTGRGCTITKNQVLNTSEHSFYVEGMTVSITDNVVRTDSTTYCTGNPVKIRGRGVTVTGNTLDAYDTCVSINEAAQHITVTGNTCTELVAASGGGGVIDINSDGLLAYLTARNDYLTENVPMVNINITGNTVNLPAASQTNGYAFRVYSDTSAGALANGHIRGIKIEGNTVYNPNKGVVVIGGLHRALSIKNNTWYGKGYTEATFEGTIINITASVAATDNLTSVGHGLSVDDAVWVDTVTTLSITSTGTGTTLTQGGVYYVKTVTDADNFILAKRKGGTQVNITNNSTGAVYPLNALVSTSVVECQTTDALISHVSFDGNECYGFRYIFTSDDAAGTGNNWPLGMRDNKFFYCYELGDDSFATVGIQNRFRNNTGNHFADRTWQNGFTLENTLNNGFVSNSQRYGCINLVSTTDVRLYNDNAGGYTQLYTVP